jgi:hypothetical protein
MKKQTSVNLLSFLVLKVIIAVEAGILSSLFFSQYTTYNKFLVNCIIGFNSLKS